MLVSFASVHPVSSGMDTCKRDECHAILTINFLAASNRQVQQSAMLRLSGTVGEYTWIPDL